MTLLEIGSPDIPSYTDLNYKVTKVTKIIFVSIAVIATIAGVVAYKKRNNEKK